MSNHCIRWKCSTSQKGNPDRVPVPEPPDLPSVVPDRVAMHVEDDFETVFSQHDNDGVVDGFGGEYVYGVRRFDGSEDKDDVVQAVVDNVVADAEWYVIYSRVCTYNGGGSGHSGCGDWVVEREQGSVPGQVKHQQASVTEDEYKKRVEDRISVLKDEKRRINQNRSEYVKDKVEQFQNYDGDKGDFASEQLAKVNDDTDDFLDKRERDIDDMIDGYKETLRRLDGDVSG